MRHNPVLRGFANPFLEAGKPKLVVIAALMRRLLHLAFGVLKHGHSISTGTPRTLDK